MISRDTTSNVRPVTTVALALAFACGLAGRAADAQEGGLRLNDREYFETRGLNVLVFTNQYNGMFFDEKTAGVEMILHGVRLVTGGAVRLSPTPEQWDQIPKVVDRKVDKATNTITCVLRYEAFDFDSRLVVTPEGTGFRMAVYVDKPVPEKLEGRAGLMMIDTSKGVLKPVGELNAFFNKVLISQVLPSSGSLVSWNGERLKLFPGM